MEYSNKRKADRTGGYLNAGDSAPPCCLLSKEDARRIIEPFDKEELMNIVEDAMTRDPGTLSAVRSVAGADPVQRKIFIRGLGSETTSEKLKSAFSSFGEITEAIVITNRNNGKSKGYGFVTFKHIDGAVLALKERNKKIDGRMTVSQLAVAGNAGSASGLAGKIYVGNIPFEISPERLLDYYSAFGAIEEGPLGFEKQADKPKGFAFFVYKSEESARAAVMDPIKKIDGYQVNCKFATEGRKGRPDNSSNPAPSGTLGDAPVAPAVMNTAYGGGFPSGLPSYAAAPAGYVAGPNLPLANQNLHMNAALGFGNQGSGHVAYASGPGGGYGSGGLQNTGAAVGSQYSGAGVGLQYAGAEGGLHYGGAGAGPMYVGAGVGSMYGGAGALTTTGTSIYRLPPSAFLGNYGTMSSGYQVQVQFPGPRAPPGVMYQGLPPYY